MSEEPRLEVYRAPMRSRDDEVDHGEAVAWALENGVVGVGGRLHRPVNTPVDAVKMLTEHDSRLGARLGRFLAVEMGSFMWTRTPDGLHLGRIYGPWIYDSGAQAARHDLPHTRACRWLDHPVSLDLVPEGVQDTFARGGRNFQRIHGDRVESGTARTWRELRLEA